MVQNPNKKAGLWWKTPLMGAIGFARAPSLDTQVGRASQDYSVRAPITPMGADSLEALRQALEDAADPNGRVTSFARLCDEGYWCRARSGGLELHRLLNGSGLSLNLRGQRQHEGRGVVAAAVTMQGLVVGPMFIFAQRDGQGRWRVIHHGRVATHARYFLKGLLPAPLDWSGLPGCERLESALLGWSQADTEGDVLGLSDVKPAMALRRQGMRSRWLEGLRRGVVRFGTGSAAWWVAFLRHERRWVAYAHSQGQPVGMEVFLEPSAQIMARVGNHSA